MLILLCFIIPVPEEPPDINIEDFRFAIIQEEWVAVQSNVLRIENSDWILDMARPCYGCRENASKYLSRKGFSGWKYMLWATYSRDPEISYRGYTLLKKYLRCEACKGTGNTLGMVQSDEEMHMNGYPCDLCNATGKIYEIKRNLKVGWKR